MGLGSSKEKLKKAEDFDIFVFYPKNITYDETGNLVYEGLNDVADDRLNEAKFILDIEWKEQEEAAKAAAAVAKMAKEFALPNDEEKTAELLPATPTNPDRVGTGHNNAHAKQEPEECYIMDSPWIESWLHYIHINPKSPRPGPCKNHRLIVWDKANQKWVGRAGLQMAVKLRAGDYRRVSKATWEAYKKYYPSSGPAIKMVYVLDSALVDTGLYDTSTWEIEDPPPPPEQKKKVETRSLLAGLQSTPVKTKAGFEERKVNEDADKRASIESTGEDSSISLLTLTKKPDSSGPGGAMGTKAADSKSSVGSYSPVNEKKATSLTMASSSEPTERESFIQRVFFGDSGGSGTSGGGSVSSSSASRPMAQAADADSDDDM